MNTDWIKECIDLKDCGDDILLLADICGEDIAKTIAIQLALGSLYVPTSIFSKLRKKYIIKHYDGTRTSIRRAALETGISWRYAQSIVNKHLRAKKSDIQPNQPEDK